MLDVRTAILNADAEDDVFVKVAPGYRTTHKSGVPLVMKLKKSLYGLRKSPKNSFGTADYYLAKTGFRPLKSDPCNCIFEHSAGFFIVTLYVGDAILLGANKQLLNKPKKQRIDRFEMTGMGDVSRVLGTRT